MKKYSLYLCLSMITLLILSGCSSSTRGKVAITINDIPVSVEEFEMLFKENYLQYDMSIRNENKIPEEKSVLDYFNNDKELYSKKLIEKDAKLISNIKAQKMIAEKYGIEKPISYDELVVKMNSENEMRSKKINNGENVFGIQKFEITQYYQYYLDSLKTKVIECMTKENQISDQEIQNYYKEMNQPLYTDQERIRYTFYFLDSDQNFNINEIENYTKKHYEMGFADIKNFMREKNLSEMDLLNFDKNMISSPFSDKGKNVFIQFEGFIKDNNLSIQSKESVKNRIVNEMYEKEVIKISNSFKIDYKKGSKECIEAYLKSYLSN